MAERASCGRFEIMALEIWEVVRETIVDVWSAPKPRFQSSRRVGLRPSWPAKGRER